MTLTRNYETCSKLEGLAGCTVGRVAAPELTAEVRGSDSGQRSVCAR